MKLMKVPAWVRWQPDSFHPAGPLAAASGLLQFILAPSQTFLVFLVQMIFSLGNSSSAQCIAHDFVEMCETSCVKQEVVPFFSRGLTVIQTDAYSVTLCMQSCLGLNVYFLCENYLIHVALPNHHCDDR